MVAPLWARVVRADSAADAFATANRFGVIVKAPIFGAVVSCRGTGRGGTGDGPGEGAT
jgi:hypothetical protein